MDALEQKISELEGVVAAVNDNAVALSALLKEKIAVIDVDYDQYGYTLKLSDGSTIKVVDGLTAAGIVPMVGINSDGKWIISLDNGQNFTILDCTPASAAVPGVTPLVRIGKDGCWEYSVDNGKTWVKLVGTDGKPLSAVDGKNVAGIKTIFKDIKYAEGDAVMQITLADGRTFSVPVENSFGFEIVGHNGNESICLSETLKFEVTSENVAEVVLMVPEGWTGTYYDDVLSITSPSDAAEGEYEIKAIAVSDSGYIMNVSLKFNLLPVAVDASSCQEWNDFVSGRDNNVLLDYSYAGYNHGESAPADVSTLGYGVYDVTLYGAVPNDGKSDREAFLTTLEAALGVGYTIGGNGDITFAHKAEANVIIYFPAGEYILHNSDDDVQNQSRSIIIRSGNLIIKGAGRDNTKIVMSSPMLPKDPSVLYSSPDMIQIKHNSSFSSFTVPVTVTESSPKGSFEVTVSSTAALSPGEWVCLHVRNSDQDYVAAELAPYTPDSSWEIVSSGVEVIDYHQIKSIEGDKVIFHEPLMHAVEPGRGWEIKSFPHYENVGIEDLTFAGQAKVPFIHHDSWEDDGAYKPLSLNRLTDSWIRRVGFESVSESCSIINSANISAYHILMTGNKGHSSVRSQSSSRVLIAATQDISGDGAGNFHGVGVSKHSIGTVLWRNSWGKESCFESHATQPRATLIDCCTGGWMRGHQGGDAQQAPHHLDDLVIWNFKANGDDTDENTIYYDFQWWEHTWWRFLPPVIVGFQSDFEVTFNDDQTKIISTHGMQASPESLYEAQLRHRLGAVPAWLNSLK